MAPRSERTRRRALRTPTRSTRQKAAISYAEPSSDDGSDTYNEDSSSEEGQRAVAQRSRPATTRQQPARKRQRPSTRSFDLDRPRPVKKHRSNRSSPKSKPSNDIVPVQETGAKPPWQTLPYHIWLQIFQYASHPLYDERTFQLQKSSQWLLKTARMCHGFAEPALTILYTSPPLVPMNVAHDLVRLLTADPLPLAFKYRQKVETLRIDVFLVAAYVLPGNGILDLHGLIKELPRLVDLEFYHQKDMNPYRSLDDTIKWTYLRQSLRLLSM
jgi:hypothetical protein